MLALHLHLRRDVCHWGPARAATGSTLPRDGVGLMIDCQHLDRVDVYLFTVFTNRGAKRRTRCVRPNVAYSSHPRKENEATVAY